MASSIINSDDGSVSGITGLKTTGGDDGELILQTNGTDSVNLSPSAVVINESGADVDFRVESDTNANAFFLEGSSGNVGVGTSSPTVLDSGAAGLHLHGSTRAQFHLTTSASGTAGTDGFYLSYDGSNGYLSMRENQNIVFQTNATERMRITSSGDVLVGTTSTGGTRVVINNVDSNEWAYGTLLCRDSSDNTSFLIFNGASGWNGSMTVGIIAKNSGTNRSLNAAGSLNASGADYAEYMTKAGEFDIAKGDICGIDSDGKLTNVFADAVAFVVKSTNPAYVGGDVWGNEDAIGKRPEKPEQKAAKVDEEGNETQAAETDEDFAVRVAQYESDLAEFEAKLEAERQKVDRIAFSGQVPVNVTGATAGQYIVPVESNGGITGIAVNEVDMTLSQYMKSVGKVIAIEGDGRARIIVKVA